MFLNSTRNGLIRIKDLDQEIEGEEPCQSRIGSGNFGAKKAWYFCGVDPGYETLVLFNKRESEISQRDTSTDPDQPFSAHFKAGDYRLVSDLLQTNGSNTKETATFSSLHQYRRNGSSHDLETLSVDAMMLATLHMQTFSLLAMHKLSHFHLS